MISQALLTNLRALTNDGTLSKEEFFDLLEKAMLALYAEGAVMAELVCSKTIAKKKKNGNW